MLLTISAAILVVLLSLVLILDFRKRKLIHGLPSGPRGIPLLGNLLQMGKAPHLQLSQWAQEFGHLYTINLAHRPTLVVNDQKIIRELLGRMAVTGKFKTEIVMLTTKGPYGIGHTEGELWLEQKQFCLRALKNFGFGRGLHMEPLILQEVEDLCDWIESEQRDGKKMYLDDKMKQVTTNILWSMISGERIISHKSKIVHLMDKLEEYFQKATQSGVAFFSWIKYLAPVQSGYQGVKTYAGEVYGYVESCFESHKTTRVEEEPPRDMIDEYIDKIKNCKDPQSSFYEELGLKHGVGSVVAFLLGGGETTGTTILWMLFYLSVHPKVQETFQKEIDMVIGQNKNPCLADKLNMPYTEAVILETLRMSSLVPFGFIHELLEDITFQGYRLSKGLLLLTNLYHVHHDNAVWRDSQVFRPERFLEGDDKLKENVIAFKPGKRSCPGEAAAKDIIFLFSTKMLQQYTFSVDPEVDRNEYLIPDVGYALMPKKLAVVATTRN